MLLQKFHPCCHPWLLLGCHLEPPSSQVLVLAKVHPCYLPQFHHKALLGCRVKNQAIFPHCDLLTLYQCLRVHFPHLYPPQRHRRCLVRLPRLNLPERYRNPLVQHHPLSCKSKYRKHRLCHYGHDLPSRYRTHLRVKHPGLPSTSQPSNLPSSRPSVTP